MPFDSVARVIDRVRDAALTDGQLLDRFLAARDEAAFAALVRRHAAMVLGVCRRTLAHDQDAEDAFQATFLVLVKRAAAVVPRDAVGPWLHGVAYRTALEARARNLRRRAREKQVSELPHPIAPADPPRGDWRPLLDGELSRLPAKYRLPVVLCDLEGRGRPEVSRRLGVPEGTLSSRLARGRKMLARRLSRRGVTLAAAALAGEMAREAAVAAPAPLVASTVHAAARVAAGQALSGAAAAPVAALAQGVLHAMALTKLKNLATLLVILTLFGTGAGLLARGGAADPAASGVAAVVAPERGEKKAAGEPTRPPGPALAGKVVAVAADGKAITVEVARRGDGRKPEEAPQKHEIKLTDKTEILFSDVGPGGAKLAPGMQAQVWTADGSKDTAARVSLTGTVSTRLPPDHIGRVTDVSADGKTITLAKRSAERPEQTFDVRVSDKADLRYSFIAPGGTKPTAGYRAEVWLKEGKIYFTGDQTPERGENARPDRLGKVVGASKDGKLMTLEVAPTERGSPPVKEEIKIDEQTKLLFVQVGPGGDRPMEGYQAGVWLVPGSKDRAAKVLLRASTDKPPALQGRVVGVAKDGKAITVATPPRERGGAPETTEVKLGPSTRVIYRQVGPGGARPTEGYGATVWLVEGSKDSAALVVLGADRGR